MRPSAIRSLFDDEALCKFCHASLTDSRPTQAEQLKRSIFGVYPAGSAEATRALSMRRRASALLFGIFTSGVFELTEQLR